MKKLFLALLLFPIYIAGNCAEIITVDGSEYIINNYDTTTVTIIRAAVNGEYKQSFRVPETIYYKGRTKTVTDVGGYYSSFFPPRKEYYHFPFDYVYVAASYTLYLPKTIKTIQGALTDDLSDVKVHFDEGNDLEYICENAFNSKSGNMYYALHLGRKLKLPTDFDFSASYDMTFDAQSDYYDYRDGCIYSKGITDKIMSLLPMNATQNIVIPTCVTGIEKARLPVSDPNDYELTPLTIGTNSLLENTGEFSLCYCQIEKIPPMNVNWGLGTFTGCYIGEFELSDLLPRRTVFSGTTVKKLVFPQSANIIEQSSHIGGGKYYDIEWRNVEEIQNSVFNSSTFMNDVHFPKGFCLAKGSLTNSDFQKDVYFNSTRISNTSSTNTPKYLTLKGCNFYGNVICNDINSISFYSDYYYSTFNEKFFCPSSLQEICKEAFKKCKLKKGIKLNAGLKTIGDLAFSETVFDSTLVVIPQGAEVASTAFTNCMRLNNLVWNEKPFTLDLKYADVSTLLLRGTTQIESLSFNMNFVKKVAFTSKTPPTVNGTFVSDDFLKDRTITYGTKQHFIKNIYSRITLYVPRGSKNDYKNKSPWRFFDHIVEYDSLSEVCEYFNFIESRGDVNADNIVDVKDISSLINNLLAGSSFVVFDVNEDGVVDVKDVTALINLILE